MKIKMWVLLFVLSASPLRAQTNDLAGLLQQGLLEEQANRNLDAAIADYQTLARQFDRNQQLAATAIFRLGECYRMQNQTNEAAAQYQRILKDFADQQALATLSRQNLAGMGMPVTAVSIEASPTQRNLLVEEIKVIEQQLASVQEKAKLGLLPAEKVSETQLNLLQAKRRLAELDAGQPVAAQPAGDIDVADEESKEIQRIQMMIQNSPDLINAVGENGNTPLAKAASNGWLKVATYLLGNGADVNNRNGTMPLLAAAAAGNKTMVQFLLDHGADVNVKSNEGKTPLTISAEKSFPAVMEVLLANKADLNALDDWGRTPLMWAAWQQRNGSKRILSLLLEHKPDVNTQDRSGATAMMNATDAGSLENVKLLLAAGADPNLMNNNGQTALSFAADKNSSEMVKTLLAAKADPNAGTVNVPLLVAIHAKDLAVTKLLLEAGASVNVKQRYDWQGGNQSWCTPLFLAVSMKQLPLIRLLLKYQADPNDVQTDNRSVLFKALDDTNILMALLDAGGNIEAHDGTVFINGNHPNWTPLAAAVWLRNVAAVEILLKHKANPNQRDEAGNTPLQWVTSYLWGKWTEQQQKIMEFLLAYGADPNVRDKDGFTPLDRVKYKSRERDQNQNDKAIVKGIGDLLRQHGALDVLPDWDRIAVSRPSANVSRQIFKKGTNDWDQFSLLDVVGAQYGLVDYPGGPTRYLTGSYSQSDFATRNELAFPNLAHVVIRHPSANGKNWEARTVDLARALETGDCGVDLLLQWGDVVEIPETDHVINQQWAGLTTNQLLMLKHCLTRHLQISVNGKTADFIVSPQVTVKPSVAIGSDAGLEPIVKLFTGEPFTLWPVLSESKRLLASSDLSRIKITRTDADGKIHEWTVDCSNAAARPNFWLRDGDKIDVPEK